MATSGGVADGGGGACGSLSNVPRRLTHKPKHKQRPKPRNRDPNSEIEIQT